MFLSSTLSFFFSLQCACQNALWSEFPDYALLGLEVSVFARSHSLLRFLFLCLCFNKNACTTFLAFATTSHRIVHSQLPSS